MNVRKMKKQLLRSPGGPSGRDLQLEELKTVMAYAGTNYARWRRGVTGGPVVYDDPIVSP